MTTHFHPWMAGERRADRLADGIRQAGLDVLLALTPENAAWLTGRTSTIATLWRVPGLVAAAATADGGLAVAAGDSEIGGYAEPRFPHPLWIEYHAVAPGAASELAARIAAARAGALERPEQFDREAILDAIAAAVRAVAPGARRIGTDMELDELPAWLTEGLRARLGEALEDGSSLFWRLRAIKDDAEIARLRLSAELTDIGIAGARDALRPGMTDTGVNAAYQSAIWAAAAADPRFRELRAVEGLVSVGDGSASALVGPGQAVKLDMQVDVGGMHSDIGRTYAIAPTADQVAVHAALRHALGKAIAAMLPGVPFREVWAAGTEAMRTAGFAGYSRGHLGHSVGLSHNYEEPPFVSATEARPLAPGMVVSVELPWYLRGVGGFQMERMVLITDRGAEPLDRLPLDLAVEPG